LIRKEAKQAIAKAGSLRRYARSIGLSASALSFAMRGKMSPPKALLDALGYERVTVVEYRRKPPKEEKE
jgi:hypothetical protein